MRATLIRIRNFLSLARLALRLQLGRRFWIAPLLTLAWPAWQAVRLLIGWRGRSFEAVDAQNTLIGIPLIVIAIGIGVRVIAGEVEQRTLEVTYTVPGGARRVWIAKLVSAALPILIAEVMLAAVTVAFFTSYPLAALYGALQGAAFYLVAAMGLGALFRSEITAALVTSLLFAFNGFATGFGELSTRWSPLFNPLAARGANPVDVFAWTVQNRLGVALLVLALIALACARAERREQLLRV
jgi:hypothetical protein